MHRETTSPLLLRTTNVTASALEQDPARGPIWIKACSTPESPYGADRAARVRRMDKGRQDESGRRMALILEQDAAS